MRQQQLRLGGRLLGLAFSQIVIVWRISLVIPCEMCTKTLRAAATDALLWDAMPISSTHARERQRPKILVVEDDATFAGLVATLIERLGGAATAVRSVSAATEEFGTVDLCDGLVLDIYLADGLGLDVLLRARSAFRARPR